MSAPANMFTQSAVKAFQACPRMFYMRYVARWKPVKTGAALKFGSALHRSLETYWKSRKRGLSQELWLVNAIRMANGMEDAFEQVKLHAMLVAYAAKWDSVECEVVEVEPQFSMPLVHPNTGRQTKWLTGGKIDLIIRLPEGKIVVVEHKSSGEDFSDGSDYRQKLTLDRQISMYLDALDVLLPQWQIESNGTPVVWYDVCGKPKQKPYEKTENPKIKKDGTPYANQRLVDETPEEYFNRIVADMQESPKDYNEVVEIVRLTDERKRSRHELWAISKLVECCIDGKLWVKNPDACFKFGSPCDFVSVCHRGEVPSESQNFRKKTSAHEELEDEPIVFGEDGLVVISKKAAT